MQYQNTLSKPHTVNAVLKVDKPHPNLDCVQNNTLEIIQKQIVKGFKNLSEALHTKQNNGEQTEKRNYQRVLKCNYCGKPGHILKHCRSKIRDESNKSYASSTLTSAGGNSLEVIGKSEFRIKLVNTRTITKSLLSN